MPDEIMYILNELKKQGYSAYIVGGSVRDYFLGKKPYDFDITTSARPDEIKRIFKDNLLSKIGEKYGTIVIRINKYDVEITTYRIEGNYKNNRKPENVVFSDKIEDDLKRRDFTINAMAYNKEDGLIDLFNGVEDLEKKIIKTVGDPRKRILEDSLRILRAIRFAAQLDFKIDDKLYDEIIFNRDLLRNLSRERIKSEIDKILLSDMPSKAFRIMADTKVLEVIFPSLYKTVGFDQKSKYHSKTLFNHILCVVDNVDKKLNLRYAALFHDIGKINTFSLDENGIGHFYGHDEIGAEEAVKILREYNSNNDLINDVNILISEHMKVHDEMTDKALRRQIRKVGKENIMDLYNLMIADRMCTIDGRDIDFLINRQNRIKELLEEDIFVNKNFLNVNGQDIKSLGFEEGKIIGEILHYLEEIVMDNPNLNKKEILLNLVVEKYRS